MPEIKSYQSLVDLNTFHIEARSKLFTSINRVDDFIKLMDEKVYAENQVFVLGGGSNILFTHDFDGLIIKNDIKGVTLVEEDDHHYFVRVGAGENWHQFVTYAINNGMAGIENLSLIPGNVGASPMQNIGAYGVEVKSVIQEVEIYDLESGGRSVLGNEECKFEYRSSIFKTDLKSKVLITSVLFKLNKEPNYNITYGSIEDELKRSGIKELNIRAISEAVCRIRRSKLPDPNEIGNGGSFFKNPVISKKLADSLIIDYPEMPLYPVSDNQVKAAAGWLIEKCGWKGFRKGDYGVHDKQALVLVNHGNAKGKEIYDLSEEILNSVNNKFGILLEREVNIL